MLVLINKMKDFWILKSIKKVESKHIKSLLWFFKTIIKVESEHTKNFDFFQNICMKRKKILSFGFIIKKQAPNFLNSFFKIYAGKEDSLKKVFNFLKYIMRKQAA